MMDEICLSKQTASDACPYIVCLLSLLLL